MSRSGWCAGLGSLPCLFAIGTGEWTWAERGDAPTLRCQGWRGNAAGSPQHLPPMQWAPCAQCWKWETLQPMWRLAVERGQKSETRLFGLTFGSIKLLRLWVPAVLPTVQKHTKLPPKVNTGTPDHTPTKSGHYQRHGSSLHNTWTAPHPSKSCPSCRWSMQHTVHSIYAKNCLGTKTKIPNYK